MNQATVKFSKEFITSSGLKEWVGIEYPVNLDTEDVYEVFNKAKDIVCNFHAMNNLDMGFGPAQFAPPSTTPVINVAHERLMNLMDDATTTEELNAYYPKVIEYKNASVTDFYFAKHEQLKK